MRFPWAVKSRFLPRNRGRVFFERLLVFVLAFSWMFSGWPSVESLDFPPKVREAQAATTGQVYPTLGATVSETPWSDDTWNTPTNIYSDNAATANVIASTFDNGDQTWVLKATGFDFSSIPDDATINGVTVRVNAWYRSGQGSGSLDLCQLLNVAKVKSGTNNCSTPTALTTTNSTVITKGSSSDLWGLALTPAWLKTAGFGVALGVLSTAANTDADIDYVTIEVTYTVTSDVLTVSSAANQSFSAGSAATANSPITIDEISTTATTAANDIRVKIPSSFNMTWDETDTAATVNVAPALSQYTSAYLTNDLPTITLDNSGVAYNPLTDSLFFIVNGTPTIYEFTISGTHVRTISMTNFIDTEGIKWMYGTTYAVTQERVPYDIVIITIDAGTTTIDKSSGTVITPTMTVTTNLGMEGIAYDAANDWFYVVTEKQAAGGAGGRVFKVEMDATTTEYATLNSVLLAMGYTDLADIDYDPVSGHFFLLSQENSAIIEATPAGVVLRTRAISTSEFAQVEGMDFSPDGDHLFLAGEIDDYQHLVRSSKVSPTVSYEDSNKTLVVNVTSSFAGSETVQISDLKFKNFSAASSADNLELEIANDNTTAAYDDKTITVTAAALTADIVNASYVTVGSPAMAMNNSTFSFPCHAVTGSFGTASQQIYVNNNDGADSGWVLTLAAQATTDVWDSAGTDYDFNDPTGSGCTDGADADSVGGQMTVDPSAATLAVGQCGSCTTSSVTKGASSAFNEGTTNSITLLTAAAGSDDIGDWTLQGVGISQMIPAEQPIASDYDINMVLTVTAS